MINNKPKQTGHNAHYLKPLSKNDPRLYSNWLKALTPEQRREHQEEVKRRRNLRQVMQNDIERLKEEWIDQLQLAATSVLKRAQESGDPTCFTAIWDRVIGKPATVMDIKVEREDSVNDIMQKLQQSAELKTISNAEDVEVKEVKGAIENALENKPKGK